MPSLVSVLDTGTAKSPSRVQASAAPVLPRCRVQLASAQCGRPALGPYAQYTWPLLSSLSSSCDRRDPDRNAAASRPGQSTVAATSGRVDFSPRESSLSLEPMSPQQPPPGAGREGTVCRSAYRKSLYLPQLSCISGLGFSILLRPNSDKA